MDDLWTFPVRWAVRRASTAVVVDADATLVTGGTGGPPPPLARVVRAAPHAPRRLVLSAEMNSVLDSLEHGSRVLTAPGPALASSLAALILDGALEVDLGEGYSGGPSMLVPLGWSGIPDAPRHRLAQLSETALHYAVAEGTPDAGVLGRILYGFHSLPYSPRRHRGLGSVDDLRHFLGLSHLALPPLEIGIPWLAWAGEDLPPGAPVAKLYLSPSLDRLPSVLASVVERFAGGRAAAVKVGGTLEQLLRPDRLVVYFGPRHDVHDFALAIAAEHGGPDAHGVPFTAAIDPDGLASWGIDPPAHLWAGGRSWRQSLTHALGSALALAFFHGVGGADATDFARARVSLDGVDPHSWHPLGAEAGRDLR